MFATTGIFIIFFSLILSTLFIGKGFLVPILLLPFLYNKKEKLNIKDVFTPSQGFTPVVVSWGLLFTAVIFSCFMNNSLFFSSDGPLFMFLVTVLFLASKALAMKTKDTDLNKIYSIFLSLIFVSIVLFLIISYAKKQTFFIFEHGSFGDLNVVLCSFTSLQLMLWVLAFLRSTTKIVSFFAQITVFISYLLGCTIFTSDVRYILLPFGLTLISAIQRSTKPLKRLNSFLLVLSLLFITTYSLGYIRLSHNIDLYTNSPIQYFFNGRDRIWSVALKGIFESPIYGHGPKAFPTYYNQNINLLYPNTQLPYSGTHSLFIYNLFSYGLLGLSALISILFNSVIYLKKVSKTEKLNIIALLTLSTWFIVVTYGIIDNGAFVDAQMGLLFCTIGFTEGLTARDIN